MNVMVKIVSVIIILALGLLAWVMLGGGEKETSVQEQTKTYDSVHDAWKDDDKRLRADIKTEETEDQKQAAAEKQPEKTQDQISEQADEQETVTVNKEDLRQLPPGEKAQAERLLELALMERKKARLPGAFTYKKMVETCREVIEKYPNTEQALKARRMLAEVPMHKRDRYNITNEELGPFK